MNIQYIHPADQLVMFMQRIYDKGLTTMSGGNLSIRDTEGNIWITPAGIDKGTLTRRDIICVRPDGTCEGPHKPSSELPFHQSVYRQRPELAALINDAQHMGFLGDLVEVAANPVKLPHKVVVGGRRRVLWNQAVHQMAQVRLTGKAAALYFFVEGLKSMRMCTHRTAIWWAGFPFPAPGLIIPSCRPRR